MGFLLRWSFRLSLVLLLVPLGVPEDGGKVDLATPIQAFVAAREAVADMSSLCIRKPDVCETGKAALKTVTDRAKAGIDMAMQALDGDKDSLTTGSVK